MSYLHAIEILEEEKHKIVKHRREMTRLCNESGIGWLQGETESLWLSDVNNAITALMDLQQRLIRGDE